MKTQFERSKGKEGLDGKLRNQKCHVRKNQKSRKKRGETGEGNSN